MAIFPCSKESSPSPVKHFTSVYVYTVATSVYVYTVATSVYVYTVATSVYCVYII